MKALVYEWKDVTGIDVYADIPLLETIEQVLKNDLPYVIDAWIDVVTREPRLKVFVSHRAEVADIDEINNILDKYEEMNKP